METENYEVHPEIAASLPKEIEVEEPQVEETQQAQQEVALVEQLKPAEEPEQAKNFRQLREQNDRIRRENEELVKLLKQNAQRQEIEPQDPDIAPDTIVEGKHLNKYDKKISKLQNELRESQQQMQLQATKLQLKTEFPDFDKVVTPDNVYKFKQMYPELAKTLEYTQDPYAAGSSAYTLFKKFGVYVEDTYEADRYKVQQNLSKPKPVTSVSSQQGSSPMAKANAFASGLTDELRKELLKEMNKARGNTY